MIRDYRQNEESFAVLNVKSNNVRDLRLIDEAWDLFAECIGEKRLKTPLSVLQFEVIFDELVQDEKFRLMKSEILESLRYDSYSWPMVER